jgi:DNA-binding NtrC family response regulator
VEGAYLAPGERLPLPIGRLVQMGRVHLVVRPATQDSATRLMAMSERDRFAARLREECARREPNAHDAHAQGGFAVAVVRVCARPELHTIQTIMTETLGSSQLVGAYDSSEYRVLLFDRAEELMSRLMGELASRHVDALCGMACFPHDGQTPEALIAHAGQRLRGPEPPRLGASSLVVVRDPAMVALHRLAERVAAGRISVLLLGETGSGKEVLAEVIHANSPRRDKPLLSLNCAAFSESLLESELFGHEKGAFSGAIQAKPGLLEAASGGTVFLDEVGEMPASLQTKLLRVLCERKVLRVGSVKPRAIDVRFVSATNRDLEEEVRRGTFREDLFFRLNGISMTIPPLRERPSEIEPLALFFLHSAARDAGLKAAPGISPAALDRLRQYGWPGNVRQLCNVMERALILCEGGSEILVEHLPLEQMARTVPGAPSRPTASPVVALAETGLHVPQDERQRVIVALERSGGNQTQAAKLLGICRTTLVLRMIQYDLPRPRAPRRPSHG